MNMLGVFSNLAATQPHRQLFTQLRLIFLTTFLMVIAICNATQLKYTPVPLNHTTFVAYNEDFQLHLTGQCQRAVGQCTSTVYDLAVPLPALSGTPKDAVCSRMASIMGENNEVLPSFASDRAASAGRNYAQMPTFAFDKDWVEPLLETIDGFTSARHVSSTTDMHRLQEATSDSPTTYGFVDVLLFPPAFHKTGVEYATTIQFYVPPPPNDPIDPVYGSVLQLFSLQRGRCLFSQLADGSFVAQNDTHTFDLSYKDLNGLYTVVMISVRGTEAIFHTSSGPVVLDCSSTSAYDATAGHVYPSSGAVGSYDVEDAPLSADPARGVHFSPVTKADGCMRAVFDAGYHTLASAYAAWTPAQNDPFRFFLRSYALADGTVLRGRVSQVQVILWATKYNQLAVNPMLPKFMSGKTTPFLNIELLRSRPRIKNQSDGREFIDFIASAMPSEFGEVLVHLRKPENCNVLWPVGPNGLFRRMITDNEIMRVRRNLTMSLSPYVANPDPRIIVTFTYYNASMFARTLSVEAWFGTNQDYFGVYDFKHLYTFEGLFNSSAKTISNLYPERPYSAMDLYGSVENYQSRYFSLVGSGLLTIPAPQQYFSLTLRLSVLKALAAAEVLHLSSDTDSTVVTMSLIATTTMVNFALVLTQDFDTTDVSINLPLTGGFLEVVEVRVAIVASKITLVVNNQTREATPPSPVAVEALSNLQVSGTKSVPLHSLYSFTEPTPMPSPVPEARSILVNATNHVFMETDLVNGQATAEYHIAKIHPDVISVSTPVLVSTEPTCMTLSMPTTFPGPLTVDAHACNGTATISYSIDVVTTSGTSTQPIHISYQPVYPLYCKPLAPQQKIAFRTTFNTTYSMHLGHPSCTMAPIVNPLKPPPFTLKNYTISNIHFAFEPSTELSAISHRIYYNATGGLTLDITGMQFAPEFTRGRVSPRQLAHITGSYSPLYTNNAPADRNVSVEGYVLNPLEPFVLDYVYQPNFDTYYALAHQYYVYDRDMGYYNSNNQFLAMVTKLDVPDPSFKFWHFNNYVHEGMDMSLDLKTLDIISGINSQEPAAIHMSYCHIGTRVCSYEPHILNFRASRPMCARDQYYPRDDCSNYRFCNILFQTRCDYFGPYCEGPDDNQCLLLMWEGISGYANTNGEYLYNPADGYLPFPENNLQFVFSDLQFGHVREGMGQWAEYSTDYTYATVKAKPYTGNSTALVPRIVGITVDADFYLEESMGVEVWFSNATRSGIMFMLAPTQDTPFTFDNACMAQNNVPLTVYYQLEPTTLCTEGHCLVLYIWTNTGCQTHSFPIPHSEDGLHHFTVMEYFKEWIVMYNGDLAYKRANATFPVAASDPYLWTFPVSTDSYFVGELHSYALYSRRPYPYYHRSNHVLGIFKRPPGVKKFPVLLNPEIPGSVSHVPLREMILYPEPVLLSVAATASTCYSMSVTDHGQVLPQPQGNYTVSQDAVVTFTVHPQFNHDRCFGRHTISVTAWPVDAPERRSTNPIYVDIRVNNPVPPSISFSAPLVVTAAVADLNITAVRGTYELVERPIEVIQTPLYVATAETGYIVFALVDEKGKEFFPLKEKMHLTNFTHLHIRYMPSQSPVTAARIVETSSNLVLRIRDSMDVEQLYTLPVTLGADFIPKLTLPSVLTLSGLTTSSITASFTSLLGTVSQTRVLALPRATPSTTSGAVSSKVIVNGEAKPAVVSGSEGALLSYTFTYIPATAPVDAANALPSDSVFTLRVLSSFNVYSPVVTMKVQWDINGMTPNLALTSTQATISNNDVVLSAMRSVFTISPVVGTATLSRVLLKTASLPATSNKAGLRWFAEGAAVEQEVVMSSFTFDVDVLPALQPTTTTAGFVPSATFSLAAVSSFNIKGPEQIFNVAANTAAWAPIITLAVNGATKAANEVTVSSLTPQFTWSAEQYSASAVALTKLDITALPVSTSTASAGALAFRLSSDPQAVVSAPYTHAASGITAVLALTGTYTGPTTPQHLTNALPASQTITISATNALNLVTTTAYTVDVAATSWIPTLSLTAPVDTASVAADEVTLLAYTSVLTVANTNTATQVQPGPVQVLGVPDIASTTTTGSLALLYNDNSLTTATSLSSLPAALTLVYKPSTQPTAKPTIPPSLQLSLRPLCAQNLYADAYSYRLGLDASSWAADVSITSSDAAVTSGSIVLSKPTSVFTLVSNVTEAVTLTFSALPSTTASASHGALAVLVNNQPVPDTTFIYTGSAPLPISIAYVPSTAPIAFTDALPPNQRLALTVTDGANIILAQFDLTVSLDASSWLPSALAFATGDTALVIDSTAHTLTASLPRAVLSLMGAAASLTSVPPAVLEFPTVPDAPVTNTQGLLVLLDAEGINPILPGTTYTPAIHEHTLTLPLQLVYTASSAPIASPAVASTLSVTCRARTLNLLTPPITYTISLSASAQWTPSLSVAPTYGLTLNSATITLATPIANATVTLSSPIGAAPKHIIFPTLPAAAANAVRGGVGFGEAYYSTFGISFDDIDTDPRILPEEGFTFTFEYRASSQVLTAPVIPALSMAVYVVDEHNIRSPPLLYTVALTSDTSAWLPVITGPSSVLINADRVTASLSIASIHSDIISRVITQIPVPTPTDARGAVEVHDAVSGSSYGYLVVDAPVSFNNETYSHAMSFNFTYIASTLPLPGPTLPTNQYLTLRYNNRLALRSEHRITVSVDAAAFIPRLAITDAEDAPVSAVIVSSSPQTITFTGSVGVGTVSGVDVLTTPSYRAPSTTHGAYSIVDADTLHSLATDAYSVPLAVKLAYTPSTALLTAPTLIPAASLIARVFTSYNIYSPVFTIALSAPNFIATPLAGAFTVPPFIKTQVDLTTLTSAAAVRIEHPPTAGTLTCSEDTEPLTTGSICASDALYYLNAASGGASFSYRAIHPQANVASAASRTVSITVADIIFHGEDVVGEYSVIDVLPPPLYTLKGVDVRNTAGSAEALSASMQRVADVRVPYAASPYYALPLHPTSAATAVMKSSAHVPSLEDGFTVELWLSLARTSSTTTHRIFGIAPASDSMSPAPATTVNTAPVTLTRTGDTMQLTACYVDVTASLLCESDSVIANSLGTAHTLTHVAIVVDSQSAVLYIRGSPVLTLPLTASPLLHWHAPVFLLGSQYALSSPTATSPSLLHIFRVHALPLSAYAVQSNGKFPPPKRPVAGIPTALTLFESDLVNDPAKSFVPVTSAIFAHHDPYSYIVTSTVSAPEACLTLIPSTTTTTPSSTPLYLAVASESPVRLGHTLPCAAAITGSSLAPYLAHTITVSAAPNDTALPQTADVTFTVSLQRVYALECATVSVDAVDGDVLHNAPIPAACTTPPLLDGVSALPVSITTYAATVTSADLDPALESAYDFTTSTTTAATPSLTTTLNPLHSDGAFPLTSPAVLGSVRGVYTATYSDGHGAHATGAFTVSVHNWMALTTATVMHTAPLNTRNGVTFSLHGHVRVPAAHDSARYKLVLTLPALTGTLDYAKAATPTAFFPITSAVAAAGLPLDATLRYTPKSNTHENIQVQVSLCDTLSRLCAPVITTLSIATSGSLCTLTQPTGHGGCIAPVYCHKDSASGDYCEQPAVVCTDESHIQCIPRCSPARTTNCVVPRYCTAPPAAMDGACLWPPVMCPTADAAYCLHYCPASPTALDHCVDPSLCASTFPFAAASCPSLPYCSGDDTYYCLPPATEPPQVALGTETLSLVPTQRAVVPFSLTDTEPEKNFAGYIATITTSNTAVLRVLTVHPNGVAPTSTSPYSEDTLYGDENVARGHSTEASTRHSAASLVFLELDSVVQPQHKRPHTQVKASRATGHAPVSSRSAASAVVPAVWSSLIALTAKATSTKDASVVPASASIFIPRNAAAAYGNSLSVLALNVTETHSAVLSVSFAKVLHSTDAPEPALTKTHIMPVEVTYAPPYLDPDQEDNPNYTIPVTFIQNISNVLGVPDYIVLLLLIIIFLVLVALIAFFCIRYRKRRVRAADSNIYGAAELEMVAGEGAHPSNMSLMADQVAVLEHALLEGKAGKGYEKEPVEIQDLGSIHDGKAEDDSASAAELLARMLVLQRAAEAIDAELGEMGIEDDDSSDESSYEESSSGEDGIPPPPSAEATDSEDEAPRRPPRIDRGPNHLPSAFVSHLSSQEYSESPFREGPSGDWGNSARNEPLRTSVAVDGPVSGRSTGAAHHGHGYGAHDAVDGASGGSVFATEQELYGADGADVSVDHYGYTPGNADGDTDVSVSEVYEPVHDAHLRHTGSGNLRSDAVGNTAIEAMRVDAGLQYGIAGHGRVGEYTEVFSPLSSSAGSPYEMDDALLALHEARANISPQSTVRRIADHHGYPIPNAQALGAMRGAAHPLADVLLQAATALNAVNTLALSPRPLSSDSSTTSTQQVPVWLQGGPSVTGLGVWDGTVPESPPAYELMGEGADEE